MDRNDKNELKEQLSKKVKEIGQGFKHSPETLDEYLSFASRFHQYSHKNLMIIYAQRPDARFVASAAAWYSGLPDKDGKPLSEKPMYIKKGEKAMYIWCPVTVNHYSKDGMNWYTVHQLDDAEKRELKEHPEAWQVRKDLKFKLGPVFDIGQVNCPKELLPQILGIGVADVDAQLKYTALCDYCRNTLQLPVVEKDFGSVTVRGRYAPWSHSIEINSVYEATQKLSTLLHELGHSQLHNMSQIDRSKSTAYKELEADMYSLMLEKQLGVETTDARKGHLADQYKAFIAEQDKLPEGERLTVDKVFDAVFARYQKTLPDIREAINKAATVQPQVQYERCIPLAISKI